MATLICITPTARIFFPIRHKRTGIFIGKRQKFDMEGTSNRDSARSGRGRASARSWRGRGSSNSSNWRRDRPKQQNDSSNSGQPWQKNEAKPKLTHFISIPLGHLPAVRSAAASFRSALLEHTPSITGLDPSIIVLPRRLHLTLGVMSLEKEISASQYFSEGSKASNLKTVSSALAFLQSLRPRIMDVLDGQPLRVPLTSIDMMKPEKNDDSRAHVLFAGPSAEDLYSGDGQRLKCVCELINSEFVKAGFVLDDKRPLKLHCTLINTSHRNSDGNSGKFRRRIPFSFAEIRSSPAVRTLATRVFTPDSHSEDQRHGAIVKETVISTHASQHAQSSDNIPVNFGTHAVSEIQICEMGSRGPEGEYVCVGKIEL